MKEQLLNKRYGKNFQEHILEQYKLYVQTAENVSTRRDSANNYFVSINAILFTISGYLSFKNHELWTILIAVVGILISFVWYTTIQSYKNLNSGKFKVIHELEKYLPANLFAYEWEYLGKGSTEKYKKLTVVEKNIPRIFCFLYLVVIVFTIFSIYLR